MSFPENIGPRAFSLFEHFFPLPLWEGKGSFPELRQINLPEAATHPGLIALSKFKQNDRNNAKMWEDVYNQFDTTPHVYNSLDMKLCLIPGETLIVGVRLGKVLDRG